MAENQCNDNTPQQLLLIEDDCFMREMITLLLETNNYAVTAVESGAAARQLLQTSPACTAVISDMYLPDSDGFTLYEEIHAAFPALQFIILTSETDETIVGKAAGLGICYIVKDENFAEAVLAALAGFNQPAVQTAAALTLPPKLFHDLTQPLNSIKMLAGGTLFLLKQGKQLPESEIADCMQKITQQADLLTEMLQTLRR